MIERNLFYKMLDIPEDRTEPTFYDLLGLQADACSAERVDHMLHIQKRRLRQNIPSPQLIPLILSFEKNTLEPAAAVLRDPRTRQTYNSTLRQQANQKERARRHLVGQARDAVHSLLNPDKTLDDSKRPILAATLRALGIEEIRIHSLIKRLPRPTSVEERSNRRVTGYQTGDIEQTIPMSRWPRYLRNALRMTLMITVIGGGAFSVWFFMIAGKGTPPQRRTPATETTSAEDDDEHRAGQETSQTATEGDDMSSKDAKAHADNMGRLAPQRAEHSIGQPKAPQEQKRPLPIEHTALIHDRLIVTAEDVRQAYTNGTRTEELLADLAMTMLACSCRATHFFLGTTDGYNELRTQMNELNRPSYLTSSRCGSGIL
jgi:hypothetical protein